MLVDQAPTPGWMCPLCFETIGMTSGIIFRHFAELLVLLRKNILVNVYRVSPLCPICLATVEELLIQLLLFLHIAPIRFQLRA